MRPLCRGLICCVIFAVLVGCSGRRPPRPNQAPNVSAIQHRVKRGETLYAISMRHSIDYRKLAEWNGIRKPYTIYPGQKLTLRAPKRSGSAHSKGVSAAPAKKRSPSSSSPPRTPTVAPKRAVPIKKETSSSNALNWSWPTQGKVIVKFSSADSTKNGIDIEGEKFQDIRVAEAGEVVYSGSGLVGYGNLVIVKHNELYLTAYGYNAEVLVKEGDTLKAGAIIAKMGQGLDQRPALHFEVRKNGRPVNPMLYLPKR